MNTHTEITCPYCDGEATERACLCAGRGVVTAAELAAHEVAMAEFEAARADRLAAELELWNAGLHRADAFGADIPW